MPSPATAMITGVVSLIVALATLAGTLLVERSRRRGARQLADQAEAQQRELADRTDHQQRELERLRSDLESGRSDADQAREAEKLMAAYLKPLARSAQDLQSRLWNMNRGFRGHLDREYFRTNTLYVVAELLGWLEIVRQEIQFLDAGTQTLDMRRSVARWQDCLASAGRGYDKELYIYRGHQRAIGELMITRREDGDRIGPSRQCLGYAAFTRQLGDPDFGGWFDRFGRALDDLDDEIPRRFVALQHASVDLLDILDPDRSLCPEPRTKIVSA